VQRERGIAPPVYGECSQPSGGPAGPRGGTLRALGAGRLYVVYPGRSLGRTGEVGDGGELPGRAGRARVMSHDVKRIHLEVTQNLERAPRGGPVRGCRRRGGTHWKRG